jgi:two-component system OmpR family response regulator
MVSASLLLVEDDREIRALLEEFLSREGFAVEAVESAAAMDRALARGFPDLIILDLMLPGEDGLSACRRIRAILRRSGPERPEEGGGPRRRKSFAGLIVDLDGRAIEIEGEGPVRLTTAEFDLLVCFLERPRRVLSRDQLLDWTRGRGADPFDRTIDVTVSRLRTKLALYLPDGAQVITTVRNAGYLLTVDVRDV